MDVHFDGNARVSLSERNLRDLLAQYDAWGEAELHRMTDEGFLVVIVENDEKHYKGRLIGPGSGLLNHDFDIGGEG